MTVFLVLYGVDTLMPQIETAYFVTRLPPGMLPRLIYRRTYRGRNLCSTCRAYPRKSEIPR